MFGNQALSASLAWARMIIHRGGRTDAPRPATPKKVKTSQTSGITAPAQTHPSVRAGEGGLGDSAKGSEFCFSFRALACKVQRLQAKPERCRKAEGGRGAGGEGGVSHTRHPGLAVTKAVSSPSLNPAPPPRRADAPCSSLHPASAPRIPSSPTRAAAPRPGPRAGARIPSARQTPRRPAPTPGPPGRAGGAEPGRAPPPTVPAPGPARAPAYLGARGGGRRWQASRPPPLRSAPGVFLPPPPLPPPPHRVSGAPPPPRGWE